MVNESRKRGGVSARAFPERLDRPDAARNAGLANHLLAIGRDCAAHLKEPYRSVDHAELLYDNRGLP